MRVLIFIALIACSSSDSKQTPAPTPVADKAIDPARAKALIAKGAVVLDVRSDGEFKEGRLDQAINIPVQELQGRMAEVHQLTHDNKSKPIVVYCSAGKRAAEAKAQLEAAGYKQVVNGGGLDDLR